MIGRNRSPIDSDRDTVCPWTQNAVLKPLQGHVRSKYMVSGPLCGSNVNVIDRHDGVFILTLLGKSIVRRTLNSPRVD